MRKIIFVAILVTAIFTYGSFASLDVDGSHDTKQSNQKEKTPWLLNNPASFHESKVVMHDLREDSASMAIFSSVIDRLLPTLDSHTDGEVVDALEHFFWGMRDGLAIELGALDGHPDTKSMTYEYEKSLNWKRILIEGNPVYRDDLAAKSPLAFSVNAAICANPSTVHYINLPYVGGIVEFMATDFIKTFHPALYNAGVPPGSIANVNFSTIPNIVPVSCLPLSRVLGKAHVSHVNYFILDVEVC